MKKIILITLFGLVGSQIKAQTSPGVSRVMSVEEANKLNGVANPTINGKPYSQFKAEQDALKQQQKNITSVPASKPDSKTVMATSNPALVMDKSNNPVHPETHAKIVEQPKPVVDPKDVTKSTKADKEPLPAALKGTSMDPEAKPVLPAAKTTDAVVPIQNSGNTQPVAEDKKVVKEDNTVPSSTKPVKKD